MNFLEEIKRLYKNGSWLIKLIFINTAVFLALQVVSVIFWLFNMPAIDEYLAYTWLSIPSYLGGILFRPWSMFTYMFVHIDFLHILFNMLMLYWFGIIFIQYFSEKQLVAIYILGGLTGGLLFALFFNIFPVFSTSVYHATAIGASASVMTVLIAIALYLPDFTIYLFAVWPLKLKYLAIFTVILDIIMMKSGNSGGHIAHLGGALFGWVFIDQFRKGNDITKPFIKFADNIPGITNAFKSKPKLKVAYRNENANKSRPVNDSDYNKNKAELQKEIDRILDKISKNGYGSLSSKEKELLFKQKDN